MAETDGAPSEAVREWNSTYMEWTEDREQMCFDDGEKKVCGLKDGCHGLLLPLFFEMTWDPNLRAALYLIGLLYRYVLPLFENDNPIALHLKLDELLKSFISPKNYSRT